MKMCESCGNWHFKDIPEKCTGCGKPLKWSQAKPWSDPRFDKRAYSSSGAGGYIAPRRTDYD